MKTVLTIAGFDPSSGAGITADLMVFAAHGLFGTSCISALTVQNSLGVFSTQAVAADMVAQTIECICSDMPPSGVKVGMLANAQIVKSVAAALASIRKYLPVIVVLDPVLRSSSGRELLDHAGISALARELLPCIDWITPNADELRVLVGREEGIGGDLVRDATELQQLGRGLNVVVTGGDRDPPDDLLVTSSSTTHWLRGGRITTSSTHGTGCAFSSALLSHLVLGDTPLEATKAAKNYVVEALRSARPLGKGKGPLNHLWPLRSTFPK